MTTVHQMKNGKVPEAQSKSEDLPHAQIISLLSGKKQEWVGSPASSYSFYSIAGF